jgi:hypothetical protein
MAAAILARVICPEQADWPPKVAQDLLKLRFANEDLDCFHALLAKCYGETLTLAEEDELESYQFVNCLVTMIHHRARRSLDKTKADA